MATERRVQGSGGQPPHHPPCADRASECPGGPGNNCPVHHLELLEVVWRGWWAWLGGGVQLLSGGRGKAGARGSPPSQASEHMGCLEAGHSPKAWIPEESSWLGPAFRKQI